MNLDQIDRALFAVVIFQNDQRDDILHHLYNLDPEHPPYQIIPQVLYLIESDQSAIGITRALGIDDPALPEPPVIVAKLSESDIEWIKKERR